MGGITLGEKEQEDVRGGWMNRRVFGGRDEDGLMDVRVEARRALGGTIPPITGRDPFEHAALYHTLLLFFLISDFQTNEKKPQLLMVRQQHAQRSPRHRHAFLKSPKYGELREQFPAITGIFISMFCNTGKSTMSERPKTRLLSRNIFARAATPMAMHHRPAFRRYNRAVLPLQEGKIARSDATPFFHDPNVATFDDPFADRRGNVQDDDSDLSAWDEETTLVELLQDSCVLGL